MVRLAQMIQQNTLERRFDYYIGASAQSYLDPHLNISLNNVMFNSRVILVLTLASPSPVASRSRALPGDMLSATSTLQESAENDITNIQKDINLFIYI